MLMLIKQADVYRIVERSSSLCLSPEDIIFALAGPNEATIRKVLEQIRVAAEDIDQNRVPQCEPQRDSFYVYAYFSPQSPTGWSNTFYIGKGTAERQFSHLQKRYKALISQEKPLAKTAKEKIIDNWLHSGGHITRAWRDVKKAATQGLLSATYGNLTEIEAFFLEKFLIMRARRPQEISNDTAGNHKTGEYTGICQPKSFDRKNPMHVALWSDAIEGFRADPNSPRVDNTLRPSLTFIGLESDITKLETILRTVGLAPCDMTNAPENRLTPSHMIKPFCSVSGAADAKLSFILDGKQTDYRFDFRVPPAGLDMTMTLRPLRCDAMSNRAFMNFFENLSVSDVCIEGIQTNPSSLNQLYPSRFIKNINNWPFYKPYSKDANARDNPVFFSMRDVHSPVSAQVNWVQGYSANLTILQAVKLIVMAFK